MKKTIAILCVAALGLTLFTGCGTTTAQSESADASADVAATTEYGIVTGVSGNEVTVTLGEISEVDMSDLMASGDASMPSDMSAPTDDTQAEAPADMQQPTDETQAGAPTDTQQSTDGTQTEAPTDMQQPADGTQTEAPTDMQQPTDMASGDFRGGTDKMDMSIYQFTAGEDTMTITIDDESIISETESAMNGKDGMMGGNSGLDTLDAIDSSDGTDSDTESETTVEGESADSSALTLDDITEGTILELSYDADGNLIAAIIRNDVMSEGGGFTFGGRNMDDSMKPGGAPAEQSSGNDSTDGESQTDSSL